MNKIKKIGSVIQRWFIRNISYLNTQIYMEMYTKYLKKIGVNIADYHGDGYIDPTVWIDGTDYSLIKIGEKATISKDVILLTHDYSIRKALTAVGRNDNDKRYKFLKNVTIGNNCFVGARSVLLPGTVVEDNVIIGSGSIVKGILRADSVYAGVPAKRVCSIGEYVERHMEKQDFIV